MQLCGSETLANKQLSRVWQGGVCSVRVRPMFILQHNRNKTRRQIHRKRRIPVPRLIPILTKQNLTIKIKSSRTQEHSSAT